MKMVPAEAIFKIEYGNKIDSNKVTFIADGINFVSRSSKNLGVVGQVEPVSSKKIYESGLITVTMGGTYLLSAFVQPEPFYTAQNIKVLQPIAPMSLSEKAYYCECIRANRFRYSTHGREANRSFNSLLVPAREDVPGWAKGIDTKKFSLKSDHNSVAPDCVRPKKIGMVRLDKLFAVINGVSLGADVRSDSRVNEQFLAYIRPSKTQTTSSVEFADSAAVAANDVFPRHTLYVSTNG